MDESNLASTAAMLLIVSFALLSAIAAAGVVLTLKVARRRRAALHPEEAGFDTGVPATPLSAAQAQRWSQRYAVAVVVGGATAALLIVLAISLA